MKWKDFYKLFMLRGLEYPKGFQKWSMYMNDDIHDKSGNYLGSLYKICKDKKVNQTSFKILHRIFFTRKELYQSLIVDDTNCVYCQQKDSIEHFLVECTATQIFGPWARKLGYIKSFT